MNMGNRFTKLLSNNPLYNEMNVAYGGMYGVTLNKGSANLQCIVSHSWSNGGGDAGGFGLEVYLLHEGASVKNTQGGSDQCVLSNGNNTATIHGSCNSTSGGDGDYCQGATFIVNITSVSGCTVSTETRRDRSNGQVVANNNYNICQ